MLAIGRALMGNPILLLEPSVGIAHRLKIEIFQAIQVIQHAGVAAHGSCAREGKLTLGRIDALNFSRRASLDEQLGEGAVPQPMSIHRTPGRGASQSRKISPASRLIGTSIPLE